MPDRPQARARGRPPKFGRPARLVAITLPTDVVAWLEMLDPDIARAIVRLHDVAVNRGPRATPPAPGWAELADIGEGRGLIVVDPALVRGLTGVAAIPFGPGRAFLALEPSWTMADLELSVVDCLQGDFKDPAKHRALAAFREQLRSWRTDPETTADTRAIIITGKKSKRRPTGLRPS